MLRESLSRKLERDNGLTGIDPERNVLVTCGATGAFEAVCATLLNPGDEVVVFEPYYPYHLQALKRYGATIKIVRLEPPNFEIDFESLAEAITAQTKFILLNTPGNPTGKVFTAAELDCIAEVLARTDALLVTDEIYEYMVFDGRRHISPGSQPGLAERTITMGGYSKTFSITGWRIGYAVAPDPIADAMAAFLDAVYVCAPAPLQQAVADGIDAFGSDFYTELASKYQAKRDLFSAGLREIGLEPIVPAGAYYMIADFSRAFPNRTTHEFVHEMIATAGVGAVPSSDFVLEPGKAPWIRFCLAVEDEVLHDALRRLQALKALTPLA